MSADPIAALAANTPGPWDWIVGIPRGGLVVAAALGYHLDVVRVGSYVVDYTRTGDGPPKVGDLRCVPPVAALDRVLVVEDSVDSGTLLEHARRHLANRGAVVHTAALYVTAGSAYRPDVWVAEVDRVPPGRDLAAAVHVYLSTGCLHGDHDYCQSTKQGSKIPAECKFCAAPCVCLCHEIGYATPASAGAPEAPPKSDLQSAKCGCPTQLMVAHRRGCPTEAIEEESW